MECITTIEKGAWVLVASRALNPQVCGVDATTWNHYSKYHPYGEDDARYRQVAIGTKEEISALAKVAGAPMYVDNRKVEA